jgi:intracellular multiplication protein IcmD
MHKKVLVPIADGVEDIETVTIIDLLRRSKAEVIVAAIDIPNEFQDLLVSPDTRPSGLRSNLCPDKFVPRRKRSRAAECTPCYMSSETSLQQRQNLKGKGYKNYRRWLKIGLSFTTAIACFYAAYAFAETKDIGAAAEKLTGTFASIGKLLVGSAYIGGFGFVIAGIFKFKLAKDSHGQIPFSTPIAIVGVGAALLFLPSLVQIVSQSVFEAPVYGGFKGEGAEKVGGSSGGS